MRRGQMWSVDFALSLVLFIGAMLIAYTFISHLLEQDDYKDVRKQTMNVGRLLAGEGYPQHWINTTIIRGGIAADGRLSLRKAQQLATLEDNALRKALRATDNLYIHVMNETNGTVPVFGECGLGDLAVASTPRNTTLPSMAIVAAAHPVSDRTSATQYGDDAAYTVLEDADVIIIEGNITAVTSRSADQIRLDVEDAARRGITIVVIGDPGVAMLGIKVNATNTTSTIQVLAAEPTLNLTNETLNISAASIPTIELPAVSAVGNYRTIALAGTRIAYAAWTYHDAQVWYLSAHAGTKQDGSNLTLSLGDAIENNIVTAPWPDCGEVDIPSAAKQIAYHDRVLPHHEQLLTIRTIVWRER